MHHSVSDTFHKISISSNLFKGQEGLYFCYLKAEKIAHAVAFLCDDQVVGERGDTVAHTLRAQSAALPQEIAELAARERAAARILSRVYSLLSLVRLCVSHNFLAEQNAALIAREYEMLAEKIAHSTAPASLNAHTFSVPAVELPPSAATLPAHPALAAAPKGHPAAPVRPPVSGANTARRTEVLNIVSEQGRVSIKDISKIIRDCSEKTIQRELNALIQLGQIRKEGDRRWSVYLKI